MYWLPSILSASLSELTLFALHSCALRLCGSMTPRASVCCALETHISIYFQASLHLIKLTCTLLLNEDFLKDRIKTPAYLCLVHMTLFVAQWFHTYSICYSDCFKLSQIFVSASITSGQMCVYIKRCIYPFFSTIHFTGVFLTSVQKYNVMEGGKSHLSSAPVFVTLVEALTVHQSITRRHNETNNHSH